MLPTNNMNCSISVGFQINERFLIRNRFLYDPKIPFTEIDFEWLMRNSDNVEDDLEKPSLVIRWNKIAKIRQAVQEQLVS